MDIIWVLLAIIIWILCYLIYCSIANNDKRSKKFWNIIRLMSNIIYSIFALFLIFIINKINFINYENKKPIYVLGLISIQVVWISYLRNKGDD